jgi:hypothetical protein
MLRLVVRYSDRDSVAVPAAPRFEDLLRDQRVRSELLRPFSDQATNDSKLTSIDQQ